MKPNLFYIILLIALTSACDTISQIFLKGSINRLDFHVHSIKKIIIFVGKLLATPVIYLGSIFNLLSLIIWLYVLSKVDLNFAFSVDSVHYIFIAFASGFFLKEKVGRARWFGTLLIMLGIVVVTLS